MSCYHITMEKGHKVAHSITSREEYLSIRGSAKQIETLKRARGGDHGAKRLLEQMNYSCLPNEDGSLKGATKMSNTVGMDVDFDPSSKDYEQKMKDAPQKIIAMKDDIGLLMLERSVNKGYHIVFRRHSNMSNEGNLAWASAILGIQYDKGAKDITRVFFTTGVDDLLFLDDALFDVADYVETNQVNMEEPLKNESRDTSMSEKGSDTFKGVLYSSIISRLLLTMGVDGKPEEGERNTYLYSLVRELRYITDFNVDKVLAVLPDWGLPTSEVRATVASAIGSARSKDIPGTLSRIIDNLLAEKKAMEESGEEEDTDSSMKLPDVLPRFFTTLIKAYPQEYKEAVLMASLPILGALATRVRSTYLDGSTHSPSFISCIVAPQASGKSFARHLYDLLTEPILAQDMIGREAERVYNEKKKATKNTKQQPEDPKAVIRLIPATASNAMILKRADYARRLHLLTFAEEIDTLTKGNRAGAWSQKSDLYRMAFDNATWGQDYMSENSYSGMVQLFYNMLICGTPNAMSRFFNDVEDGLVSRVSFITLPDMLGCQMPKFGKYGCVDKRYIRSACSSLFALGADKEEQEIWLDSASERKLSLAFTAWLEDKRMIYLQDQDNPALDIFRRRASVIGYRAGMVCWALEGKLTKESVDFSRWVAEVVLHNLLELFGEKMNETMNRAEEATIMYTGQRNCRNSNLLQRLPSKFGYKEVMNIRMGMGLNTRNVGYIISRWAKNGLVEKIDEHTWVKLR